jgi:hypothetical protein
VKRLNLSTTGKIVLVGLAIGLALLFFAPDHTVQGVGLLIVVATVLPICYAGAVMPARKRTLPRKGGRVRTGRGPGLPDPKDTVADYISDAVTPPDSAWEREARRRRGDGR